jgi:hypothetical protein
MKWLGNLTFIIKKVLTFNFVIRLHLVIGLNPIKLLGSKSGNLFILLFLGMFINIWMVFNISMREQLMLMIWI